MLNFPYYDTVGVIEGVAEATASITKGFSGALSDWLRKRKFLVALGYGLGAMSKPIFPLASAIGWIVTARFFDRVGKGIRDAPSREHHRRRSVMGRNPENVGSVPHSRF